MADTHEDQYEAEIDAIVNLVYAGQSLPPDVARALFLAMDAIRWCRWARGLFQAPDEVSDGELRQWIGERLVGGDLSIVRGGDA